MTVAGRPNNRRIRIHLPRTRCHLCKIASRKPSRKFGEGQQGLFVDWIEQGKVENGHYNPPWGLWALEGGGDGEVH